MNVLAVVPTERDVNPGQRFRIEQWEPYLRERGVRITYSPFGFPALSRILYQPGRHLAKAALMALGYLRQMRAVLRARSFDLVYVFREAALIGPAWLESLIARQSIPMVFDFDDAIFVPYVSPANGRLSLLKCFGKTARLCRMAREVMAGNEHLRAYASRHNPNVTVVPTTIDTSRYRPELRRPHGNGVPAIGWTGSYSTLQHLRLAVPFLSELAQRHRFRLVVVGPAPIEAPGVPIEFRRWSAATEAEDLADVDVGIMPLPDDEWSRGKCGLKALQFMALGIPTVASPVGVNTEIVSHGSNGFIAGTNEEWVTRLSQLIEDPSLRERMGRTAASTVAERYSARAIAPRVASVFERARART